MGYLLEGALGALADGGEARVATDLIHGVKKNAPLCCEIGHCDHNDVLFMVVAFRGAEKSLRPLSERTAASTILLKVNSLHFYIYRHLWNNRGTDTLSA